MIEQIDLRLCKIFALNIQRGFVVQTFLILVSLVAEPGAAAALTGDWGWQAWAGWLFLVLFGSFIGYTLFMRLLRDIGASRAGAFCLRLTRDRRPARNRRLR